MERATSRYSQNISQNTNKDVVLREACNLELIHIPEPWPPYPPTNPKVLLPLDYRTHHKKSANTLRNSVNT